MRKLLPLLTILNIIFFYCNEEVPFIPDSKQICIQGFLFANKPINDIRVTSLADFKDGKTNYSFPPINNAAVNLYKNNNEYKLSPSPGDNGYYHYSGSDLKVEPGDTFKLKVEYKNNTATAETTIPNHPKIVNISADTLYILKKNITDQHNAVGSLVMQFNINKGKKDVQYFIIQVKNVSQNYFIPDWNGLRVHALGPDIMLEYTEYIYPYYYEDEITELCIYIFQINEEYSDMHSASYYSHSYTSFEEDSNIKNAFGLFTGLASDSATFYIKTVD